MSVERSAGKAAITGVLFVVAALSFSSPSRAAECGNDSNGFSPWLESYKAKARASGISQATLDKALTGVTYDHSVIARDRSQKSFKLSFEEFYQRRAGSYLISQSNARIKQNAELLSRIEQRYGVPPQILVAIWGLETNFGKDGSGKYSIIRSIATLAYDCRRSDFFKDHFMAALRIVQKGDMSPAELVGGWAGEIGQVQFLPGSYDKYAVDFDGNGRRDLVRSVPDALASTASFLKGHGWQKGAPWSPGTPNYEVIKAWNKADVYARTIALVAEKLAR